MPATKKTGAKRRLVIVESPTKANTIRRYLPDGYEVMASMGHVRDLPANAEQIPDRFRGQEWARLGMRIDADFEPLYVVTKPQVIRDLKRAMKDVSELVIATDEDREGESIGWHLIEVLEPRVPVKRMVFHEITEPAIREALGATRDIDRNLVEAQETRRLLDRLVGYTISPLLWRKIAPRLSAGRVQSVAVRILVQREKERLAFVPASYWGLDARLATTGEEAPSAFGATLSHLDGVRLASGKDFDPDTGRLKEGLRPGRDLMLLDEDKARALQRSAADAPFTVAATETKDQTRHPAPPFTTSTLQQESSRKLGLSARDTMRVAQGLYERGLITYMRTDSTNLSGEAIGAARRRVEDLYGDDYLFERVRQYKGSARNAQEAHEAIRPAGAAMRTAKELALKGRDAQLYDLIWKRTLATQMAEAKLRFTTARIRTEADGSELLFRASGRTVLFPGFFRAYVEGSDDPEAALDDKDQPLPALAGGDDLSAQALEASGHETRPPARFTEASLVKVLEQEGIGRPSTYATIIDTIQNRGYVRGSGNQLVPTFTAFATNNLLERQFAQLVDTEFTAAMEDRLDQIASGKLEAIPYLKDFYSGEHGIEARVAGGLDDIDPREISTITSSKWDPYLIRVGRYGPYVEAQVEGERVTTSIPDDWAPGDVTREHLAERIQRERQGDVPVGHAEDGSQMLLKHGPYGPYLQLGPDDQEGRPKRVSLPPNLEPEQLNEDLARRLLALPRDLGAHPDSGKKVDAGIGRFGPYVRHGGTYASLKPEDDVLEVSLPRAVELLAAKRGAGRREPLRTLGEHPDDGAPVELHDGRFGPYVKHGKLNASLRKEHDPAEIDLEQALTLLTERAARKGSKAGKGGGKGASAKAKPKSKAKAKPARPKATPEDLEPFLHLLDEPDRLVVIRTEGMDGFGASAPAQVARELSLDEAEVAQRRKRGLFKLRMAFGRSRS